MSRLIERSVWRGVPLRQRLAALLHAFFMHPQASALVTALEQRKELKILTGRGVGLLGMAPPGGGKTTFARHLESIWPRVQEAERTYVPFVSMEVPSPCTPGTFCNGILHALGDPNWDVDRLKVQRKRAHDLLRKCGTDVLAIDNVQDIPDARGPKGMKLIGNEIRNVIDQVGVVVLLLGTREARAVLDSNPQLKSRCPGPLTLCDYDITTRGGLASFLRLLSIFDEHLPLAESSGLGQGRMGWPFALASNGRMRHVVQMLNIAISLAVAAGREHLTLEDLRDAYLGLFLDGAQAVNPFDPKFKEWRRLDRAGEPHFELHHG